jgi:hypothetical protein
LALSAVEVKRRNDLAHLFACEAVMSLTGEAVGDVLASCTTMQWNSLAKCWSAGAPMDDANLNRRRTIRVRPGVAYA